MPVYGQTALSVLLYLDVKSAFNAMNHRAIFIVLETFGFPAANIDLIYQMYFGPFLSIGHLLWKTAAFFSARGLRKAPLLVHGCLLWYSPRFGVSNLLWYSPRFEFPHWFGPFNVIAL